MVYDHQWQRELPNRRMLNYFDTLTPVHTVDLDGIEYVRIYDMRNAPRADYTVEWGNAIRLVYYDTFSGAMLPGQRFDMTIYFVKTGPLDKNVNIKFRMVDQDGRHAAAQRGLARRRRRDGQVGDRRDRARQQLPRGHPRRHAAGPLSHGDQLL